MVRPRLPRATVVNSNQSFHKLVYFMHPGYRDFRKRVLRIALEDLHADLIHFDNISMQAQPPTESKRLPAGSDPYSDILAKQEDACGLSSACCRFQ